MNLGEPFATAVLACYYSILGILAAFGIHRLVLVVAWARHRRDPLPTRAADLSWPHVTVQLPLYNELYVADRLLDAIARLDYPSDRLEIQVLDDSTDETFDICQAKVAQLAARGVNIVHHHRLDRVGFKAGALAAGLVRARGELIAIFDADFVPLPDFLRQTVPYFLDPSRGPKLGMVQACWDHLNRDFSLLTRIQAIFLDGHFLIEQQARNRSGCFFNFNGTAGVWRRQAIEEAGGWQHDTLTEDLDLSYRAQLAGWNFLFLPDYRVPAELPVDVNGFKSQQHRWAMGSVQTGRKLLPSILRSDLSLRTRLEALVHLSNNLSYPLMVALSLLVFPAMILRRGSEAWKILALDLPLFAGATLSVLVFYAASQIARGPGWQNRLRDLPLLMGVGIGLAISNSQAAIEGLFRRGGTFIRTPKYRIEGGQRIAWRQLRYRSGRPLVVALEGLFAIYFGITLVLAFRWGMWLSLPFLLLFFQGYCYIFALSLLPRLGFGKSPTEELPAQPTVVEVEARRRAG